MSEDPPSSPNKSSSASGTISADSSGNAVDPSAHTIDSNFSQIAQQQSSGKFTEETSTKGGDPDGTYDSEVDGESDSDSDSDSESEGGEYQTSGDNDSTHGESINPTKQDSYENFESTGALSEADRDATGEYYHSTGLNDEEPKTWDSAKMSMDSMGTDEPYYDESSKFEYSSNTNSRQMRPSVLAHAENPDVESSVASNIGMFRKMGMSTSIREVERLPDDEEPEEPRYSTFPSNNLLMGLVLFIILCLGVVVGVLTYYLWDKQSLDPLIPPGSSGSDIAGYNIQVGSEYVPTDTELLNLFAGISSPEDLNDENTPEGKAARWMLFNDTGKTDPMLLPRSAEGWQQRYILALTYFATTSGFGVDNTDSSWLSCNPPSDGGAETCEFTYPTELPNGQVIYDLVPSYRWLSGADECLWGGVGCTAKVYNNDIFRPPDAGAIVGSAVSSIVLGDQNLNGAIVTELLNLPELTVLDLSHNGLKGSVSPAFGNFTKVKLSNNDLQGTIPANMIGEDSPLEELDLGSNRISGFIPDGISHSTSLKILSIENNKLKGTIPIIGNMPLEVFRAQNNQLEGILPFDYGYEGQWPSTLREWLVQDNELTGYFPQGIGYLTNLEDFRVSGNSLKGTIPDSLGDMERLLRFDVDDNRLTGSIPESMANISSIQDARFQLNGFTGTVPTDFCFLESVVALEANCFFDESEAQSARIKAQSSVIGTGSNNDVIPVFSSLEEAVAAAREGGYIATQAPQDGSAPQFEYTEVGCACCTTCCNPDTLECLTFATDTITTPSSSSSTSSSGMVTNIGLTKEDALMVKKNSIEV